MVGQYGGQYLSDSWMAALCRFYPGYTVESDNHGFVTLLALSGRNLLRSCFSLSLPFPDVSAPFISPLLAVAARKTPR